MIYLWDNLVSRLVDDDDIIIIIISIFDIDRTRQVALIIGLRRACQVIGSSRDSLRPTIISFIFKPTIHRSFVLLFIAIQLFICIYVTIILC